MKKTEIKNYEELVKKAHPNACLNYINNQPGYYAVIFNPKNPDDCLSKVYYTVGGNLIKEKVKKN